jgi:hypothetical protein
MPNYDPYQLLLTDQPLFNFVVLNYSKVYTSGWLKYG